MVHNLKVVFNFVLAPNISPAKLDHRIRGIKEHGGKGDILHAFWENVLICMRVDWLCRFQGL
jgi:hypothetical protein